MKEAFFLSLVYLLFLSLNSCYNGKMPCDFNKINVRIDLPYTEIKAIKYKIDSSLLDVSADLLLAHWEVEAGQTHEHGEVIVR